MPCAHYSIKITSRSKGGSAVAQAAYQAGERLYDERTHRVKSYVRKRGVIHTEIILPDNAPREYTDRNTLWNAVEKNENQYNAQTARKIEMALPRELPMKANIRMVQEYCIKEFVSKGMIADIAIHDPDPPGNNPHVHVQLTMRAMDENGKWLPKSRREYLTDENGNRIKDKAGKDVFRKVNTTDWNDLGNAEKWRDSWEKIQNYYLQEYGRSERISMKSYKRQGIDRIPTVHMGPAVTAMERKGIKTEIGDLNREIRKSNELIAAVKKAIEQIKEWLSNILTAIREKEMEPKQIELADMLDQKFREIADIYHEIHNRFVFLPDYTGIDGQVFLNVLSYLRNNGLTDLEELNERLDEIRALEDPVHKKVSEIYEEVADVRKLLRAGERRKELDPVQEKYRKIYFKARKEKFCKEHEEELKDWQEADKFIKEKHPDEPFDLDLLQDKISSLKEKLTELEEIMYSYQDEIELMEEAKRCADILIPGLKYGDLDYLSGSKDFDHMTLKEKAQFDLEKYKKEQEGIHKQEKQKNRTSREVYEL